ncbi:MAG: rod shape-determining protein RodA [Deltaproteobacteria bacterium]|jgi:rod shape determining protein RodA|nr:rod shape-determining protein RodA [Deltaproteobacteria bacterium]MDA8308048.1 rod shape-determining protein RodA [Deltaproteobacteria bacterium]
MMDRRLIENFDWSVIWTLSGIVCIGLLSIYSAVYPQIQAHPTNNLFVKQLIWLAAGLALMCATLFINYQRLRAISPWLYAMIVFLLAAVLVVGKQIHGSKRWLEIAGIQLQPSEFVKVIIIIQLASYFSSQEVATFPSIKKLFLPVAMTLVPVLLVLAEPDLGSAIALMAVAGSMILFVGVRWKYLAILILAIIPLVIPIWHRVLKPYQKERILILLKPNLDPLGAGYHIRQSKIAIGSGMLWGKGFLKGTQNKLHFLPEKQTDFIFSVWAEEWGFVGCAALILLLCLLIFLILRIAARSRDRFGSLIVVGVAGLIMWQALINIGMVVGLLPVVGITLPFVSYGGSSIVALCVGVGLAENVSMRRYVFQSH